MISQGGKGEQVFAFGAVVSLKLIYVSLAARLAISECRNCEPSD